MQFLVDNQPNVLNNYFEGASKVEFKIKPGYFFFAIYIVSQYYCQWLHPIFYNNNQKRIKIYPL